MNFHIVDNFQNYIIFLNLIQKLIQVVNNKNLPDKK